MPLCRAGVNLKVARLRHKRGEAPRIFSRFYAPRAKKTFDGKRPVPKPKATLGHIHPSRSHRHQRHDSHNHHRSQDRPSLHHFQIPSCSRPNHPLPHHPAHSSRLYSFRLDMPSHRPWEAQPRMPPSPDRRPHHFDKDPWLYNPLERRGYTAHSYMNPLENRHFHRCTKSHRLEQYRPDNPPPLPYSFPPHHKPPPPPCKACPPQQKHPLDK